MRQNDSEIEHAGAQSWPKLHERQPACSLSLSLVTISNPQILAISTVPSVVQENHEKKNSNLQRNKKKFNEKNVKNQIKQTIIHHISEAQSDTSTSKIVTAKSQITSNEEKI